MALNEQDLMRLKPSLNAKRKVDLLVMEKQNEIKPCIKCGGTRRYPPRPGTKTGACIDCSNARNKRWEENNKARVKEIQQAYKERDIENWKKIKCRSAEKERKIRSQETKARNEVNNAIKKGLIKPVSECSCSDCNAKAKDYHHEDYSKPLDVVPLCRMCHIARHKNKRKSVEPCIVK